MEFIDGSILYCEDNVVKNLLISSLGDGHEERVICKLIDFGFISFRDGKSGLK